MKLISARKGILSFGVSFLLAHPSKAVGFAAGPSLGVALGEAGYYSKFGVNDQEKSSVAYNFAAQLGLFAKLDLWLWYAKLDPLFVLDWSSVSQSNTVDFSTHIRAPMTVGISLFDLLRPHAGLVCRIDFPVNKLKISKYTRENEWNSWFYLLGIGLDLGNFLIDLDYECGLFSYPLTSKGSDQCALRVGYNLLGLMG